jgi:hypothetical protein
MNIKSALPPVVEPRDFFDDRSRNGSATDADVRSRLGRGEPTPPPQHPLPGFYRPACLCASPDESRIYYGNEDERKDYLINNGPDRGAASAQAVTDRPRSNWNFYAAAKGREARINHRQAGNARQRNCSYFPERVHALRRSRAKHEQA